MKRSLFLLFAGMVARSRDRPCGLFLEDAERRAGTALQVAEQVSPADRIHSRLRLPLRRSQAIAALLAAPLYLDGYAALPLVRALIDRGMAEGAAMAFLIAGGIISAWTAVPVFALVRLPVFLAYIAMALVGSTLAGWGYAMALT